MQASDEIVAIEAADNRKQFRSRNNFIKKM